jgi:hypothetical protein
VNSRASSLIVASYAWIVAVLFGAILLDAAYARLATGDPADVRDLLLAIVAVVIVAGIGAVVVSWGRGVASVLLLISVALVGAELLAPAILSVMVDDIERAFGFGIGPWIRLGGIGTASVLAFVGWWLACRATRMTS